MSKAGYYIRIEGDRDWGFTSQHETVQEAISAYMEEYEKWVDCPTTGIFMEARESSETEDEARRYVVSSRTLRVYSVSEVGNITDA